jgi:hypothetical protein
MQRPPQAQRPSKIGLRRFRHGIVHTLVQSALLHDLFAPSSNEIRSRAALVVVP